MHVTCVNCPQRNKPFPSPKHNKQLAQHKDKHALTGLYSTKTSMHSQACTAQRQASTHRPAQHKDKHPLTGLYSTKTSIHSQACTAQRQASTHRPVQHKDKHPLTGLYRGSSSHQNWKRDSWLLWLEELPSIKVGRCDQS